MLNIAVCDERCLFATHIIKVRDIDIKKFNVGSISIDDSIFDCRGLLKGFCAERDYYYCFVYSVSELEQVTKYLDRLNIPYQTESLDFNLAYITKTQGIKYASRSEAIEHILNDKEPESMIIPNLKKKLQEKEEKIAQLTNELNLLKQKHALFEERISKLEKLKGVI